MDNRQYIRIRGANEHNLKNISLDIPRNELVVLTGLSGSGTVSYTHLDVYKRQALLSRFIIWCWLIKRMTEVFTEEFR